jgi:hypothetical protein
MSRCASATAACKRACSADADTDGTGHLRSSAAEAADEAEAEAEAEEEELEEDEEEEEKEEAEEGEASNSTMCACGLCAAAVDSASGLSTLAKNSYSRLAAADAAAVAASVWATAGGGAKRLGEKGKVKKEHGPATRQPGG